MLEILILLKEIMYEVYDSCEVTIYSGLYTEKNNCMLKNSKKYNKESYAYSTQGKPDLF
jgi:NAD(P)H-flavin reductase